MRSFQEFTAGRVDKDAVFFCVGAAGRQVALPTDAAVPAEARRTPSGHMNRSRIRVGTSF